MSEENLKEFLSPRFVGKRFDDHSIPFEVLKDLAVLEEMVKETAKWKYLSENPERKRAPRGFGKGISLKLSTINEGSAIPIIEIEFPLNVVEEGGQTLFIPKEPDNLLYFSKAKDAIVNAIDSAENGDNISDHLPDNILPFFDRLGRSLQEGECLEFAPGSDDERHKAKLTKETRRTLLLASEQIKELTEEITIRGYIPEADQDKMCFDFQPIGGARIKAPIDSTNLTTVLDAFTGYRAGTKVIIEGIGKFTRNGKLKSIESIEQIATLDDLDVSARIDELRFLKNGWLDGKGFALPKDGLNWLSEQFDNFYPDQLELPYIYPTPEGGVQIEWTIKDFEVSLEIDFDNKSAEWQALHLGTDEEDEKYLDLTKESDWEWVVMRINEIQGEE